MAQAAANLHEALSSRRSDYGSTTQSVKPDSESAAQQTKNVSRSQRFAHSSRERLPRFVNFGGDTKRYMKMSVDTMPNSESKQLLERLEFILNVLNQMCIGFVTIYLSWLCLHTGLSSTTSLHAWLVTLGFSFFMAEGVMIHYGSNVLTTSYKRHTKTTIHWVLLTLGGGCGVAGALLKMIQKGFVLSTTHGKLGFSAFILCLLTMLGGVGALFSMRIRKLITPLLNKTFHNFLGIATFVVALMAQYYGYQTGFFSRRADPGFVVLMKSLSLISLVLSCIGPLKALYHKCKNIWRQF